MPSGPWSGPLPIRAAFEARQRCTHRALMSSAPLVSVIMPAYNSGTTIDDAITSALAQDHERIEVIVVDDGSSDDTVARASSHGSQVRVLQQRNAGPQAARNRALQEARGEYVAFLDSDDLWLPGKLSAQIRLLQRCPDVVAAFTRWHVWEPDADGCHRPPADLINTRVTDDIDEQNSGWLYGPLLMSCMMLTTTVTLRTATLSKVGLFDPALRVGEDYDLWLRLSREGRIMKLASIGALYRHTETSASRKPHAVNYEHLVVNRAVLRWGVSGPGDRPADPQQVQRRLESLRLAHANLHLMRGDPKVALAEYGTAFRHDPLRPRIWLNALRATLKLRQQARHGS